MSSQSAKLQKNTLQFLNTGGSSIIEYATGGIKYNDSDHAISIGSNGDVQILNSLTVKGTTTYINTEQAYVSDNIFNIGWTSGSLNTSTKYGISIGGDSGDTGPGSANFLYNPNDSSWKIDGSGSVDVVLKGIAASTDLTSAVPYRSLSNEITSRTNADTSLTTRLSNEESNRTSADTSLTNADTSLTTRLSNEESNRTSADSSLDTRITSSVNIEATEIAFGISSGTGITSSSDLTWNGSSLGVSGSINCNDITCTSDKKLKTNIEDLKNSDVIHSLRSVQYNWVNPNADQRVKYGFVAQEVQEVLPSIVNHGTSNLSLDYIQIISHLVKEVQKLRVDVDALMKKE